MEVFILQGDLCILEIFILLKIFLRIIISMENSLSEISNCFSTGSIFYNIRALKLEYFVFSPILNHWEDNT